MMMMMMVMLTMMMMMMTPVMRLAGMLLMVGCSPAQRPPLGEQPGIRCLDDPRTCPPIIGQSTSSGASCLC